MIRVNIAFFPGTNSHREAALAFSRAGATPHLTSVQSVMTGQSRLDDADIICLPGGFSYGDHVRSGLVAAHTLLAHDPGLTDRLRQKPVLCICNGFQIAMELGLFGREVVLGRNIRGTFLDRPRQPHQVLEGHGTFWLQGLDDEILHFPCAHGEGRLIFSRHQQDDWRPVLRYPRATNPDGSQEDIAGITSRNGFVLGMMDHPERAWRDEKNMTIFRNAVAAVRS
ncbi:MAG: phosphoribosylformylglycinamidine synthase subunit PurQ [Magnetococcus sp. DMHC-1]|nr:phosphoribosylformylglycinamidine synthase subunit PurQ [Magnetococcales bacterium]